MLASAWSGIKEVKAIRSIHPINPLTASGKPTHKIGRCSLYKSMNL